MMNTPRSDIALVTGASSGIGYAAAHALRTAGYRVFGTSRRPGAKGPDGVTMLACDVTDDASVAQLVEQVLREGGRIDLLVNNAGIGLFGGAEESSVPQAQSLFDVNVFGVIRMTNAVLPGMRHRGAGRIINLSSAYGFIPAPYFALYAATKHAVEGYSQSLDHELRAFGVRVVVVQPTYTRTAFDDNLVMPDRLLGAYDAIRGSMKQVVAEALQQGDTPEIVAAAILKAATDKTPKLRYPAGKLARRVSLLRRFVPEAGFDRSLRKMLRLPV